MTMPLQFTPSEEKQEVVETTGAVVETATEEPAHYNIQVGDSQNYSIIDTADKLKAELIASEEIDKLVSTINANDPQSIITFGNEVAEVLKNKTVLKIMNF